ncbi:23845_t:CDS:2 [Entrophospora sp. SA101]|nr:4445_t:CDS:2 [Entrophospora sp. SA101]CAJ0752408.1 23845_t:CDS:2 [Entrophospora sp. SA101]
MTILNSDLSDPFGILAISGEYLYYTRTPESLKVDGFEVAMAILGAVEVVASFYFNPKNWTSKHVSEYLYYCLQSSSLSYPPKIISELTNYIKQDTTNFNGRKFLRLKEDQLKQMGFNNNSSNDDDDDDKENKWINLIMIGVKSLRRDMLKDKILLKNNNNNKQHDNYDDDDQREGYFNYFDYNYEDDDLKEKEKEINSQ